MEETVMFKNIGKKIKILALVLFWIQVAAYAITGLVFIIEGVDSRYSGEEFIFSGLLIMLLGPLVAWIGSFFTYGLGELIDKTAETARNTEYLVTLATGGSIPVQQIVAVSQAAPIAKPAAPQYQAPVNPVYQPSAVPAAPVTPAAPAAPAAPVDETVL